MSGVAIAFLAAVGWGMDAIVTRQGLRYVPPVLATLLSLSTLLPAIVVLTWLVDPGGFGRLSGPAILWYAMAGVINFAGGRQCNLRATRALGASRAAALIASAPVVAVFLAVTLLGEQLTWQLALGVALTVGGVALVVSGR